MKQGKDLETLAEEVLRQAKCKRDLVVPPLRMAHNTDGDGHSIMVIEGEARPYDIGTVARRQLAKHLDIPLAYFDRMQREQPLLLDHNVNTWLHADPQADSRLVRTMDHQLRAFLSTSYRRIENVDLMMAILPELRSLAGCEIVSCDLTDTRLYLKAVSAKVSCEVGVGDVVQAGVVISNSEVGCGHLKVEALVYRLKCLNGLILPDSGMRKMHVGARLESGDQIRELFQQDTLAATDAAFFLQVRDVVRNAVSEANLRRYAAQMRQTSGVVIEGDVIRAVEVLANRFDINHEERSGILRQMVLGGDNTGYGLLNAVTAHAQEVQSYDRATELEQVGGLMLGLNQKQWREIATAH